MLLATAYMPLLTKDLLRAIGDRRVLVSPNLPSGENVNGDNHVVSHEAKQELALQFAIKKGILHRCLEHQECVYLDSGDLGYAFRSAAYEFARRRHPDFSNQREFTDYISAVVGAYVDDECPLCDPSDED